MRRLLIPGVIGAALGAYALSNFPGDAMRPYIAAYLLLMGAIIIGKAFRTIPARPFMALVGAQVIAISLRTLLS